MDSVAEKRRAWITAELARNREVRVAELSARFAVSEVVIRRDLARLERHGCLKRVHGGAVPLPRTVIGQVSAAAYLSHAAEKERIGRAAAALICEGDQIILDSGSTVLQLGRHIPGDLLTRGNLTVITNSLQIVRELGVWTGVNVMVPGGIYLPQYDIVVGPQTVESLRELRVDKMFVGAKGLTRSRGVTTSNVLEAEVDRTACEVASEVILLADASKIGVESLATVVPLARVHKFITDARPDHPFIAEVRQLGVEVLLV